MLCPSGHTVTGRFFENSVLKKEEFYNKKGPSKVWSGVHLLHDNASSHKYEVFKSFSLASEKVKVLNHPPFSPDLSPCDFFLFQRLMKMLSGNKYTSRSSLGNAIYQCLQQIPKEDYLSAFRDLVKRLHVTSSRPSISQLGTIFTNINAITLYYFLDRKYLFLRDIDTLRCPNN